MILHLEIGEKVTIMSYDKAIEKFAGTSLKEEIIELNNKTNLFQKDRVFTIDDLFEDTVTFVEIGDDHPCQIDLIESIVSEEKQPSILEEAEKIRGGDRQSDYGDAVENFKRIAGIASEIRGKQFDAEDVAVIQIALKLCRERFKHKRDNLVDLCGYADILQRIKEDQENGTK